MLYNIIMNRVSFYDPALVDGLQAGSLAVMPTDTQYGLMASIDAPEAVEKIYHLKERDPAKALIVVAASVEQLLEIPGLDRNAILLAEQYWPGAVTVLVPCAATKLKHVHRGLRMVGCRVPASDELRRLLEMTGPLVAPSANRESEMPAGTIQEAYKVFGDAVEFYVDGWELKNRTPSTIIKYDEDGLVEIVRQGAVDIPA